MFLFVFFFLSFSLGTESFPVTEYSKDPGLKLRNVPFELNQSELTYADSLIQNQAWNDTIFLDRADLFASMATWTEKNIDELHAFLSKRRLSIIVVGGSMTMGAALNRWHPDRPLYSWPNLVRSKLNDTKLWDQIDWVDLSRGGVGCGYWAGYPPLFSILKRSGPTILLFECSINDFGKVPVNRVTRSLIHRVRKVAPLTLLMAVEVAPGDGHQTQRYPEIANSGSMMISYTSIMHGHPKQGTLEQKAKDPYYFDAQVHPSVRTHIAVSNMIYMAFMFAKNHAPTTSYILPSSQTPSSQSPFHTEVFPEDERDSGCIEPVSFFDPKEGKGNYSVVDEGCGWWFGEDVPGKPGYNFVFNSSNAPNPCVDRQKAKDWYLTFQMRTGNEGLLIFEYLISYSKQMTSCTVIVDKEEKEECPFPCRDLTLHEPASSRMNGKIRPKMSITAETCFCGIPKNTDIQVKLLVNQKESKNTHDEKFKILAMRSC